MADDSVFEDDNREVISHEVGQVPSTERSMQAANAALELMNDKMEAFLVITVCPGEKEGTAQISVHSMAPDTPQHRRAFAEVVIDSVADLVKELGQEGGE